VKKIIDVIRNAPVWVGAILIIIASIFFFLTIPYQYELIETKEAKKVYYVDGISDAHQEIIDKFNVLYKDEIEVIPVNLPFSEFTTNDKKSILTRSLRNRSDGIDIFAVDLIWISRFSKWSHPLENDIDSNIISKFNDIAIEACYQNENLLAFPLFLDMGVLYYRKDLINELPDGAEIESKLKKSITWKEFIELGKRFNNSGNPFYIFPGGDFEGMICNYHEMLSKDQSDKIFLENPFNLHTDYSSRALQQMVDFIYKYKFTPTNVTDYDDFTAYINGYEKNAVFQRGWIGFPKHFKEYLKDTTKIKNMHLAPLPHFEGNKTSSVFGGWSLMISKFSERKEEALKFILFLFEKENQIILYEKGGYLPVNTDVYSDSLFMAKNEELKTLIEIIPWAKHRPFIENYTRLSKIMSKQFHKALRSEITVSEALDKVNEKINFDKELK